MRGALKTYFGQYGNIELTCLRNTGRFCYGFVQYKTVSSALMVLQTRRHYCCGVRFNVKQANVWHTPSPAINHFETMNDDCILEIFERIDLFDLCNAAEVCTQFKRLADQTFSLRFKKISLPPHFGHGGTNIEDYTKLFRHFGSLIEDLSFFCKFEWMDNNQLLNLIGEHCTDKLKRIHFSRFHLHSSASECLKPLFANLQALKFTACVLPPQQLFAVCGKLEKLGILFSAGGSNLLRQTFPRLRKIRIDFPKDLVSTALEDFLVNHNKIKSCCLRFCNLPFGILPTISQQLPELEKLKINDLVSQDDAFFEENVLSCVLALGELKSLKVLELHCDGMPIIELTNKLVTEKIPIKEVTLTPHFIDSNVVNAIGSLNRIEKMCLAQSTIQNADSMVALVKKLPMLRELNLFHVDGFDLAALKKLIPHIKHLTKLDIETESIQINADDYNCIMDLISGFRENNGFVLALTVPNQNFKVPNAIIEANRKYFTIHRQRENFVDGDSDVDSDGDDDDEEFVHATNMVLMLLGQNIF